MKKVDWTIAILAALAGAVLLGIWYYLGFYKVDTPLDLMIAIIWWTLIFALVIATSRAENYRRRAVRTFMIGDKVIFNPELGMVPVDPDVALGTQIAHLALSLEYGFGMTNLPEGFRPREVISIDAPVEDVYNISGTVTYPGNKQPQHFANADSLAELMQVKSSV